MPITDRLLARREINANGCWIWRGTRTHDGYGRIKIHGRPKLVHRLAAAVWLGEDSDLPILHSCDTPPCFNPAHLRAGTQAENLRDAVLRGRIPRGPKHHRGFAKLTWSLVRQIRTLSANHVQNVVLADVFRIDESVISRIIHNQIWWPEP